MSVKTILTVSFLLIISSSIIAQDLSGTWEGTLLSGGFHHDARKPQIVTGVPLSKEGDLITGGELNGVGQRGKMIWEIVQCDKEVFGVVYFFPIDTKKGDVPNSWYTWLGKLGREDAFPFSFIQGRYLDGLGEMPVYQFNVWNDVDSSRNLLKGTWYKSLESLHTLETPMGYFVVRKTSATVSDPLWMKRKEKRIQLKLKDVFVSKN